MHCSNRQLKLLPNFKRANENRDPIANPIPISVFQFHFLPLSKKMFSFSLSFQRVNTCQVTMHVLTLDEMKQGSFIERVPCETWDLLQRRLNATNGVPMTGGSTNL